LVVPFSLMEMRKSATIKYVGILSQDWR